MDMKMYKGCSVLFNCLLYSRLILNHTRCFIGSFWSITAVQLRKIAPKKPEGEIKPYSLMEREGGLLIASMSYINNWHSTDTSSWHLHQLAEYWHHPAAVINSFSWKQASHYSLNVLLWSVNYFRALRKELFFQWSQAFCKYSHS